MNDNTIEPKSFSVGFNALSPRKGRPPKKQKVKEVALEALKSQETSFSEMTAPKRRKGETPSEGTKASEEKSNDTDSMDLVEVEISWLETGEINSELVTPIKTATTLQKKIETFDKLTKGGAGIYYDIAENKCLKLTHKVAPFDSHALTEEMFLDKSPKGAPCLFVSLFENHDGEDDEVLKLRLSPDGQLAELMWIRKGEKVSGSDLLKEFFRLEEMLGFKKCIIYDDSHIFLDPKKSSNKINLRLLLTLSSASKKTWYEEKGNFSPIECDKLLTTPSPPETNRKSKKAVQLHEERVAQYITQNIEAYNNAKELLRNTPLSALRTHLKGFSTAQKFIDKIKRDYKFNDDSTIQELLAKMNQAKDFKNIYEFFVQCLDTREVKGQSEERGVFQRALVTLDSCVLFERVAPSN